MVETLKLLMVPGAVLALNGINFALEKLAHVQQRRFLQESCIPGMVLSTIKEEARKSGWLWETPSNGALHVPELSFVRNHARVYRIKCSLCGRHKLIVTSLFFWPAR